MPEQRRLQEYLEWAKQKLNEVETTLVALDGSVEALKKDARTEADRAIARIKTARDAFKVKVDAIRLDASAAKAAGGKAYDAAEAEWTEIESAFQDYLKAAAGQAGVVKKALADRAEAQRQSWQTSLQAIRASAAATLDQARIEIDAAIRRLTVEAEKAEARIGKVSAAGDESWKTIKGGLDEAISVYVRTWKKISEAVSKI